jgi:hypothetical protein
MMALRVSIPKVQLDGDGDGFGTNDTLDYRIVLADVATPNMGVGWSTDLFLYYATARGYRVVANSYEVRATAGAHGGVEPAEGVRVWYLGTTTVVAQAEQPGWRVRAVEVDGAVAYTNAAGDNSAISVSVEVGPATKAVSVAAFFEPQTYAVAVESTHAWFGTNAVGNPAGAGAYPYGSAVTVGVDRIAVDPENPGRRLRAERLRVE